MLWGRLPRIWADRPAALVIVKPETVITWHAKVSMFWTWKGRLGRPGRPTISREVRNLIRRISQENPLWVTPRIHGELLKLGIAIGETIVSKYRAAPDAPIADVAQFLENHVNDLVSLDFFTVPTIRFQVLYVFLVLAHDRRRIVHVNITAHPTAE